MSMKRRSHTRAAPLQLERVARSDARNPTQWRAGGTPGRPWKVPERWAPSEVSRLQVAVAVVARMDGLLRRTASKWTAVARLVGTRSGAQCRRRWIAQHSTENAFKQFFDAPMRAKRDLQEPLLQVAGLAATDDGDANANANPPIDLESLNTLPAFPLEDLGSMDEPDWTRSIDAEFDPESDMISAHYGLLAVEEYNEGSSYFSPTKMHRMVMGQRLTMGTRSAAPFVFGPPPPPPSNTRPTLKQARLREEAQIRKDQASITGCALLAFQRAH